MGKNQRAQGLGFLISARLLAQLAVPLSLTAFRSALHNDLSLEAGVGGRWAAPGGPTTLKGKHALRVPQLGGAGLGRETTSPSYTRAKKNSGLKTRRLRRQVGGKRNLSG